MASDDRRKPMAQMWVLINPNGEMEKWAGATITATDMRKLAGEGRMGIDDYERLGTDAKRWQFLKRKGYRVMPALVQTFVPTR